MSQTRSARRSAASVRVTRSGGGFGEWRIARAAGASAPTASSSSRPGKSDAMWPSGPTPFSARSIRPMPSTTSAYAAAASSRPTPESEAANRCTSAGSTVVAANSVRSASRSLRSS